MSCYGKGMVGDPFTGKGSGMAGGMRRNTYLQEYLCLADLPVIIPPKHCLGNALACPAQVTLVGEGVGFNQDQPHPLLLPGPVGSRFLKFG